MMTITSFKTNLITQILQIDMVLGAADVINQICLLKSAHIFNLSLKLLLLLYYCS